MRRREKDVDGENLTVCTLNEMLFIRNNQIREGGHGVKVIFTL
jgi:hypothetical protein